MEAIEPRCAAGGQTEKQADLVGIGTRRAVGPDPFGFDITDAGGDRLNVAAVMSYA